MNKMTEIALSWLHMGVTPIPCFWRSKRPRIAWERFETVPPSEDLVKCWFASEHTNLAIIMGGQGLVVIDFDSFDAYELWLEWYVDSCPPTEQPIFETTYRVVTGRGVHLYLFVDEHVETSHVFKVVDIKATGYVLAPPSIHPSGRHYRGNDLPVLRVPTLRGIVPEEWLTVNSGVTNWQVPAPMSNDPLKSLDQVTCSVVEGVRNRFRIIDFVGPTVPTRDGWLVAHCPFHDDREPSFWIDTRRQLCGCYAGCTPKPLDVINLFGRLHGLDNQQAIRELARRL